MADVQRSSFWARYGVTLLGVMPASLFVGLMFATAGFAVHPPLAFVATPFICDGTAEVESQSYSYRPGQSGVTRTLWCVREGDAGGKPARDDITTKAMAASFLVYSAIAFVALQLLAWWLWRRAAERFGRLFVRRRGGGTSAGGVDLSSLLSQVAEAVERGNAQVEVRSRTVDLRGDGNPDGIAARDPAERLERLERLRDQGLITAAEYQAKRAEILSGL